MSALRTVLGRGESMSKVKDYDLPLVAIIKCQEVEMLEENSFTEPKFLQGEGWWRRGGVLVDVELILTWPGPESLMIQASGMLVRAFLDCVNWCGKTRLRCGWPHYSMRGAARFHKKSKSQWSTSVHLFLLFNHGCNVTNWLIFQPTCLVLYPGTVTRIISSFFTLLLSSILL